MQKTYSAKEIEELYFKKTQEILFAFKDEALLLEQEIKKAKAEANL